MLLINVLLHAHAACTDVATALATVLLLLLLYWLAAEVRVLRRAQLLDRCTVRLRQYTMVVRWAKREALIRRYQLSPLRHRQLMVSFQMLVKAVHGVLMLAADEHSVGREVSKHSLRGLVLLSKLLVVVVVTAAVAAAIDCSSFSQSAIIQ